MNRIKIGQLRENLMDVLKFVKDEQGRVVVTRYGKPVAEIVPVQSLPAKEPARQAILAR